MEYIESLFNEIIQGLSNVGNIDAYYGNIYNNISAVFDNLNDLTNKIVGVFDKIENIQNLVLIVIVMLIVLFISNVGQSSKLKLLIEKVEELEGKENERINQGNKRNGGECT